MKNISYYIILFLVISTIVSIAYLNASVRENRRLTLKQVALQDSVFHYRTKSGELVSKIEMIEVDKKDLKKSLEASGFTIKELKDKDIQWRKITDALKLKLQSTGQGTTTVTDTFRVVEKDTVYFQLVNDWTNSYLSIYNATIENKRLDFNYSYQTGINIFQEKRPKETIVTVSLLDPNASIMSGKSITIKNKLKWYEKPWLWGIAGFTTGIIVSK